MMPTHRKLCQESLDCAEPHEINLDHVFADFCQVLAAWRDFCYLRGDQKWLIEKNISESKYLVCMCSVLKSQPHTPNQSGDITTYSMRFFSKKSHGS